MTKVTVGLTDPYPVEFLPQAEATLDHFIDGPAFDTMAELHGVQLPGPEDRDARMAAIADMSDNFWDLRGRQGGAERQELKFAQITCFCYLAAPTHPDDARPSAERAQARNGLWSDTRASGATR